MFIMVIFAELSPSFVFHYFNDVDSFLNYVRAIRMVCFDVVISTSVAGWKIQWYLVHIMRRSSELYCHQTVDSSLDFKIFTDIGFTLTKSLWNCFCTLPDHRSRSLLQSLVYCWSFTYWVKSKRLPKAVLMDRDFYSSSSDSIYLVDYLMLESEEFFLSCWKLKMQTKDLINLQLLPGFFLQSFSSNIVSGRNRIWGIVDILWRANQLSSICNWHAVAWFCIPCVVYSVLHLWMRAAAGVSAKQSVLWLSITGSEFWLWLHTPHHSVLCFRASLNASTVVVRRKIVDAGSGLAMASDKFVDWWPSYVICRMYWISKKELISHQQISLCRKSDCDFTENSILQLQLSYLTARRCRLWDWYWRVTFWYLAKVMNYRTILGRVAVAHLCTDLLLRNYLTLLLCGTIQRAVILRCWKSNFRPIGQ